MESKKNFIWAHLLHLGSNMWNEEGNTRGREHRSTPCASDILRFDRPLWEAHTRDLKDAGINTLIIDVAEAMQYTSHPEISAQGALSHRELSAEVDRLRAMGFEVIPKLNFSTAHDIWLKDYSRMISTPAYYQVCRDLIEEVATVFRPKHFHLGMDEETMGNQRNQMIAIVRQHELWWHDFYYLLDCVERVGARPWIWADYFWSHPEECIEKMPKSVVMCGWYYWKCYGAEIECSESKQRMLGCFARLSELGFDQVPTASVWAEPDNLEELTAYCAERIHPEHWLGMMQTTWERIDKDWMHVHQTALKSIANAKRIFEEHQES